VDLERHRQLVGDALADHLLVVLEGGTENREPVVEPLDLVALELGPLLERRQPRLPEDLVDPRAADPGDRPLVPEQRVKVTGLVEDLGERVERRCRPRLRAERRDHLVVLDLPLDEQLRPGPLLGAELAQPQLAPVGEPDQDPRCAVAKRGALVE
jgi:hypothetical protein